MQIWVRILPFVLKYYVLAYARECQDVVAEMACGLAVVRGGRKTTLSLQTIYAREFSIRGTHYPYTTYSEDK
jgi:hypothetical protein